MGKVSPKWIRRLTVAAATLLLAAGPGPAPAAAMPTGPAGAFRLCPPTGSEPLARDAVLRIYSARDRGTGTVRACDLSAHTTMTLLPAPSPTGPRGPRPSVGEFRLAGHVVGYLETQFGVDSGSTALVVDGVAARRTLRRIAGGNYVDAGLILREGISDFLVTSHGAVAWITQRSGNRVAPSLAVHVAGRTGPEAVLDEGPGISARSLALSRGVLSWSDASVQHTARLR